MQAIQIAAFGYVDGIATGRLKVRERYVKRRG
jgi:hypothetical protein